MTERKLITCPETGHLEEAKLERTPLGLVVTGCSRYPREPLGCARECARRMDLRDRKDVDDRERVLLVLANLHDDAARIGSMLAEELAADRLAVEIAELGDGPVPPLADYDAVVIGAHVRSVRHDRAVIEYIREHTAELVSLPGFFYAVGGRPVCSRDGYPHRMTRRTGWIPAATATFADATAVRHAEVRTFARCVADEIPAVMQPSMA